MERRALSYELLWIHVIEAIHSFHLRVMYYVKTERSVFSLYLSVRLKVTEGI